MNWSAPVSNAEAYARAVGRRRYNDERHLRVVMRRAQALKLVIAKDFGRGSYAAAAREMGVHRSTVGRWLKSFRAEVMMTPCPTCLRDLPNGEWQRLKRDRRGGEVIENPFSVGGQLRMAAIGAICAELPRVLADLGIFVEDALEGDTADADDEQRKLFAAIVKRIVDRVDAA